jgi:hypothetical protein
MSIRNVQIRFTVLVDSVCFMADITSFSQDYEPFFRLVRKWKQACMLVMGIWKKIMHSLPPGSSICSKYPLKK